jgi:hypothetical protein
VRVLERLFQLAARGRPRRLAHPLMYLTAVGFAADFWVVR